MSNILCVDLDGTLLNTDSLHEAIFCFIKKNPLRIFWLFFWLSQGRAYLKQKIAQYTQLDVSHLPYNQEVLTWIKEAKAQGQKLVLVTAAHISIAEKVAAHLGLFDEVLASRDGMNLKSHVKASTLNQHYGRKQYDYMGNSHADVAVWQEADQAILVNTSSRLLRKVSRNISVSKVIPRQKLSMRAWFKAIRVHQYAKNILVFIPLLASHAIINAPAILHTVLGFICFSLTASSVYLLNDLLDLKEDRAHPTKSKRAIASGMLSIPKASMLSLACLTIAISASFFLPPAFQAVLAIYYVLTLAYSFQLKQIVLVDVIVLSILYTLRIVAGIALLVEVTYSPWLLLFSMLFFLSLAFLKRVSELHLLDKKGHKQLLGRNYHTIDLLVFATFGIVSGFMSILVFTLYLSSDVAIRLYHHPQLLLLIYPFMLYWLCRIWLLAMQGKVHDDPVLHALRDKTSYYIGIIILIILSVATV
ncbi:MAG: UbiA family prenyltransferase [Legionellaceae bacterium]|nr:UbiA family prenyltransferase [Legionellaceae bacterium]